MLGLNIAVDNFHVLIFIRTRLIHCSFVPALTWTPCANKQKKNCTDNSVRPVNVTVSKVRYNNRL